MKDIILKIKDEDGLEFTTEGRLYSKGSTTLIQYEETELSGMEGCTTSLTITPARVRMKRSGENMRDLTEMVFESGRRMHGLYATPYGNFGMEILTNSISGLEAAANGSGKLSIDYSMSLKGLFDTRKKLIIEFRDKNALPDLNMLADDGAETDDVGRMLRDLAHMFAGEDRQNVQ